MGKLTLKKSGGLTPSRVTLGVLRKPSFDSLFGAPPAALPDDNPLDDMVDYDGTPEEAATQEADAVLALIQEGRTMRLDAARKRDSPDCYLVVVFQHVEQRDEFLTATGWDDRHCPYLDGLDVARRLNIPIQAEKVPVPQPFVLPVALRRGIKFDA